MSEHIIPPMTHPLSSGWHQPKLENVLIDDTHALMSQKTFDALHNYSHSMPSGVYEGKMWKCAANSNRTRWWLRWFGYSSLPDMVSNHIREIIIVS